MDMLQGLLGGAQQQQQFQDFTQRYEQGAPWDGITDQESLANYQQVAGRIPPDVYQQSAEEAFSRLSPEQRMQLGQHIAQQAPQYGVQFDYNQDGVDDRLQDPRELATMSSRLEQQQPGLLGQLLGGAGGGMLGGGAGGGMLGSVLGGAGGGGGMLASPIAKAALGGIAAMAMKRMMSGR